MISSYGLNCSATCRQKSGRKTSSSVDACFDRREPNIALCFREGEAALKKGGRVGQCIVSISVRFATTARMISAAALVRCVHLLGEQKAVV